MHDVHIESNVTTTTNINLKSLAPLIRKVRADFDDFEITRQKSSTIISLHVSNEEYYLKFIIPETDQASVQHYIDEAVNALHCI